MPNKITAAIKRANTKGDLVPKLFAGTFVKLGYSNLTLKDLEIRNKMFNKIERKYSRELDSLDLSPKPRRENKTIWICWLQGFEKAPAIVKSCIASVREFMPDYKLVEINEYNYMDYADIPGYIVDKWKSGVIGNAHFSDLIRLGLLIEHGGIWVDSTVLLTGRIPDYILNSPLFLYSNTHSFDTRRLVENWFIKADSNSPTLRGIRDMLYKFWEKENKCLEYFMFNLFAYMVMRKFPDETAAMPIIPTNNCYLLYESGAKKAENVNADIIKSLTPVHKLSYRFTPEMTEPGTFFSSLGLI